MGLSAFLSTQVIDTTTVGRSVMTAIDAAAARTAIGAGTGTIGGTVGATDNRLVRSDGTGAATVQSTGITVDDSNNVSGVGTVSCGSLTTSGNITVTGGNLVNDPGAATHGFGHYRSVGNVFYARDATGYMLSMNSASTAGFQVRSAYPIGWSTWAGGLDGTPVTAFYNPSSGTVQQRSGSAPTTSQCFEVLETYTSATSQAGLRLKTGSTQIEIGSYRGSAGGSDRPLVIGHFGTGSTVTAAITVATTGVVTFAQTPIIPTKTPASAAATGTAGEICWDSSYIYICTATNTWKRAALATW